MKPTDVKIFLSGALADGGAQSFTYLSLGGFRSSSEVPNKKSATPSATPIAGVTINFAGTANSNGTGTLTYTAAAKELQWTPPSGVIGLPVVFTANATKIIYANDVSMWVEVTVVFTSLPIANQTDSITILDNLLTLNNLFDDVKNTEAKVGIVKHRGIFIKNTHVEESIASAKMFIALQRPFTEGLVEFAFENPINRLNGSIQTIDRENISPTGLGTTVDGQSVWTRVTTKSIAVSIPGSKDLKKDEFVGLWFRRIIFKDAVLNTNSVFTVTFFGDVPSLEN